MVAKGQEIGNPVSQAFGPQQLKASCPLPPRLSPGEQGREGTLGKEGGILKDRGFFPKRLSLEETAKPEMTNLKLQD